MTWPSVTEPLSSVQYFTRLIEQDLEFGLHNLDQYDYLEGPHEKVVLFAADECVFLCNWDFDAARLIPETLDGAVQAHLDDKMPPVLYRDGGEIYCPFG